MCEREGELGTGHETEDRSVFCVQITALLEIKGTRPFISVNTVCSQADPHQGQEVQSISPQTLPVVTKVDEKLKYIHKERARQPEDSSFWSLDRQSGTDSHFD